MVVRQNLNMLLNKIKTKKEYTIILYSKLIYVILLLLKKYCVKSMYLIGKWILVYFFYDKNLMLKTFNLKDKKNIFTYEQLKKKKYVNGIIFSSKGVFSIEKALELKQGGILFCLIYSFN